MGLKPRAMLRRSRFLAALSLIALEAAALAAPQAGNPSARPNSGDETPPPAPLDMGRQSEPVEQVSTDPGEPLPGDMIEFQSDELTFDDKSNVVTATGNVVVAREGQKLTADKVVYDRGTGKVVATGNVLAEDSDGGKIVAPEVELNDTLKDGVIENVLLVLADNSRLAANSAVRRNGVTTLDHAIYSPCSVVDADSGCPKTPLWAIKAVRVVHDPARKRVFYRNARLEMLGVPIAVFPRLSHPDSFDSNQSGLLSPNIRYSRELGGELEIPYYWSIAPDRDLTATARVYTGVNPVIGLEYRQLFDAGPIRIAGRMTYAPGDAIDPVTGDIIQTSSRFRGYLEANGQLSHGDWMGGGWRSSFSTRLTTDDNFPGRYQISLDDTLRTTYALERFRDNSYISIGGWAFQSLRRSDGEARTPLALPLIDVRWRPQQKILGGSLLVVANSLGIYRSEGQRMARALSYAQWDRALITGMGQRITFTGLVRGDIYHVSDSALADDAPYAGKNGWQGRVIPLAAVDIEWPLMGPMGGGTQVLTPRVQFVASTTTANANIPNEDSRAIDLEETNLFSLNRFPGYDRWEGGGRVTYGMDWKWNRPKLEVMAQFGQSYRLDDQKEIFPEGTGLTSRFSDFVGRVSVRYGPYVEVVQRLRLDHSSLAVRRSETDVSLGSRSTYVTVGYLNFNRDIDLEDLVDHEELRFGGRLAFARYWAVFGSAVIDLTKGTEGKDYLAAESDGYQPIRHRIGLAYADECFDFSVTWRRNYVDNPNARRGNTFLFSISLKNLGT